MHDCTFENLKKDMRPAVVAECVSDLSVTDSESRNCEGLLRHYRCNRLTLRDNRGMVDTFTEDQASAYEAFRAKSLEVNRKMEEVAQLLQNLSINAEHFESSGNTLTFEKTQAGRFILTAVDVFPALEVWINGEKADAYDFPKEYFWALPYAVDISRFLKPGENRIELRQIEGRDSFRPENGFAVYPVKI